MPTRKRAQNRHRFQPAETLEPRIVLDSTVVFSEIMYNPAASDQSLEWIELHNQMSVDIDMSGWRLDDAVDFTFPEGTILGGGDYLVIAAAPAELEAATGFAQAVGPFDGNLSNRGERIELRNHTDRLMNFVQYGDDDQWPVGPDGSGATLSKRTAQSASDLAANWTTSSQLGGTPGARNFPEGDMFDRTTIMPLDVTWRYDQSGSDLGTAWRAPDFDDSAWPAGPALLFVENSGLPGPKNTPLTVGQRTYYFRTTFEFSGDTEAAAVRLNHVVDDGAIFYLNGHEVSRFNMAAGAVTSSTFASAAVGNAAFNLSGTIDASLLQQGTNTLAVEVHQISSNSSDIVFGTEVVLERPIVDPGTVGLDVQLSEIAAASEPSFWFELFNHGSQAASLDGYVVRITGPTGGEFVFNGGSIPAGGYLTVDETTLGFAPVTGERIFLLTPERNRVADAVVVTNELRGRAGDQEGRWQIPAVATPGAANRFDFHDEIVINEIMYNARPTYATSAVIQPEAILSLDDTWKYDDSGTDQGTAWREPEFDDSFWSSGGGLFFVETGLLPGPKNTPLLFGQPTYYFRTTFDFQGEPSQANLALRHVVDDGAVFYLNGSEFGRYHVPAGEVTFDTLANVAVGDAQFVGPVSIPANLLRQGINTLAVEVHQQFTFSPDVVFGAELSALIETTPATDFEESNEEWLEIYNRGHDTVDLTGWRIDDAIEFEFAAGTTLAPGQYATVARHAAALADKHPGIAIVGQYSGTLSDSNENIKLLDNLGNIADEVHYFDGGRWPAFADGNGSSSELRDPDADNAQPEAWAASDESQRSAWQHVSYTTTIDPIVFDPPINFHEFVMGLLAAGEIWLDNISVVENPGGTDFELIQNGDFEADTAGESAGKWRIQGTHGRSEVIDDPDQPGNKLLRLVADARINYLSNHAETTLADDARVVNGRTYQISYDAKWIAGSPQLHTELYYKDAARTTILAQPVISGTPGAVNSTAEANIGPVFADFGHAPVVPTSTDEVVITVRANDPDAISTVTLFYAVDGNAPFSSIPMTAGTDGIYTATIPPQANNRIVQFYVAGQDSLGATSMFPAAGPRSRALYKVLNNFAPDPLRHDFQILMTPADRSALHLNTNMMHNSRQGSTVIYDGREVFYDVGTRLRGSMFSRQNVGATGYNVRFHAEQPFRGVHETVAFDQNGEREILSKFLTTQSGHLGGTYDDVFRLATPSGSGGGPTLAYLARHDDVFLEEQFENGEDGTLFKFEGIRVMTSTVDGTPEGLKLYQPIGWVPQFDIQDLGNDKELYRWPFLINRNRDRDDYTRLIDMAKAFSLTGDALNDTITQVMDVDNLTQTFALMSLLGIGDVYSQGNPHNLNFYVRPADNKVLVFPWDWDFTFSQSTSAALHGGKNIGKILDLPHYEHFLLGHMHNLINTVFNRQYMSRWTAHFGSMLGDNYDALLSNIQNRGTFVSGRLPAQTPFALDTNAPGMTVAAPAVTLGGSGWINVKEVRLAGQADALAVDWLTPTSWEATVPLDPGLNELVLEAYDFQGTLIDTAPVNVTSTVSRPVLEYLRISEIMYHPSDPTAAEQAAGFTNDNDFEFIELVNISSGNEAVALDLAGVSFNDGVDFTFGTTTLMPGERTVVVHDQNAFQYRYGDTVPVAGVYSGALSNNGERIVLQDNVGATILDFAYEDSELWAERADGIGASIQVADPVVTPFVEYGKYYRWRGSTEYGGSPGTRGAGPVGVVVNEVLSRTEASSGGTDSIELYNTATTPIDIGGWLLSDSGSQLSKFSIPNGTILEPNGYLVFDESHFNPTPSTPGPNDFALNGVEGDDVWLVIADASGQVATFVDDVHFGAARDGETFGRIPNGSGRLAPQSRNSLGCANSHARVGPVIISEVNYHPGPPSNSALAIAPGLTPEDLEFIEIHNPTTANVDMTEWRLRGGVEYEFDFGTTISAGGTLVILSFNPDDSLNAARLNAFRAHYGSDVSSVLWGGFAGSLSDSGEGIELQRPGVPPPDDPDSVPRLSEDALVYDDLAPWPSAANGSGSSLARVAPMFFGSTDSAWTAAIPTPGVTSFLGGATGDFTSDGVVNASDVDLLLDAVNQSSHASYFDLDGNAVIDADDVTYFVEVTLGTSLGDANLDGIVDGGDFTIWSDNRFASCKTWATGDFNGDGGTDGSDFHIWNENKFGNLPATAEDGHVRPVRAPLTRHFDANAVDQFMAKDDESTFGRRGLSRSTTKLASNENHQGTGVAMWTGRGRRPIITGRDDGSRRFVTHGKTVAALDEATQASSEIHLQVVERLFSQLGMRSG